MKSKNFIQIFIATVLFIACNVNSYGQGARRSRIDTILERVLEVPYDNEGRAVDMCLAQECISFFEPAMKAHGITDSKVRIREVSNSKVRGRKVTNTMTLNITHLVKLTTAETFGGVKLKKWLEETIGILDPFGRGDSVGIQLSFGIYTEKFLNHYFPKSINGSANQHNVTQWKNRENRITVFVVPLDKITGNPITADCLKKIQAAYMQGAFQLVITT